MTFRAIALLSIAAGATAGCASTDTRYPSLQIRDVERAEGQFEPVESEEAEVVEIVLPDATDARLAALVEEARQAHAEFVEAVPRARRLASAASGSEVASDAWASAQIALADLDSARSLAAVPLGDLDILFIDASLAGAEREAIAAARDEVIALVAEEDAILAQLRSMVP